MSMNLVTLLYLIASICFIQALKGLSHPTTSRRGNLFGMLGMGLAVITTIGWCSNWRPCRQQKAPARGLATSWSACWSAEPRARSWPNVSK